MHLVFLCLLNILCLTYLRLRTAYSLVWRQINNISWSLSHFDRRLWQIILVNALFTTFTSLENKVITIMLLCLQWQQRWRTVRHFPVFFILLCPARSFFICWFMLSQLRIRVFVATFWNFQWLKALLLHIRLTIVLLIELLILYLWRNHFLRVCINHVAFDLLLLSAIK